MSWYIKTLFQTQNDLKYKINDMSTPSSRISSKAEIENQKALYLNI